MPANQYRRLQRDLGLPRSTEGMLKALEGRLLFVGDSTILRWLNDPIRPQPRDLIVQRPISRARSKKERKRPLDPQFRYPLRNTSQRTLFQRRHMMDELSDWEAGPTSPRLKKRRKQKPNSSFTGTEMTGSDSHRSKCSFAEYAIEFRKQRLEDEKNGNSERLERERLGHVSVWEPE